MSHLYELTNQYKNILEQLTNEEEIGEESIALLNSVESDLKEKALNIARIIQNFEVEFNGIDEAVKRMQIRQVRVMKKIEWLKKYLKDNLVQCDVKEIRSPEFDIRIKQNPPSVGIMDEALIPTDYYKEIVSRRLDKQTILQELKNNIFIPGTYLERQVRVEIK